MLSDSPINPFGVPGEDYSAEYPVKTERLYSEKQVRRLLAEHGITAPAAQEKQG